MHRHPYHQRRFFRCDCSSTGMPSHASILFSGTAPPRQTGSRNPRHVLHRIPLLSWFVSPGRRNMTRCLTLGAWLHSGHGFKEHVSGQVFFFSYRRSAPRKGSSAKGGNSIQSQSQIEVRSEKKRGVWVWVYGSAYRQPVFRPRLGSTYIYLYSTSSPFVPHAPAMLRGASPVHSLSRRRALKPLPAPGSHETAGHGRAQR